MNYASWIIDFSDPKYGIGPEEELANHGIGASGFFSSGPLSLGGLVIGYLTQDADEAKFSRWRLKNLTSEQALNLAQQVNSEAYLDSEGQITFPPLADFK
jgi:hypothetical protein